MAYLTTCLPSTSISILRPCYDSSAPLGRNLFQMGRRPFTVMVRRCVSLPPKCTFVVERPSPQRFAKTTGDGSCQHISDGVTLFPRAASPLTSTSIRAFRSLQTPLGPALATRFAMKPTCLAKRPAHAPLRQGPWPCVVTRHQDMHTCL